MWGEGEMVEERDAVARAQARLAAALDGLEAAIQRRIDMGRESAAFDAEIQLMAEDRSRLAQELDRAQARAARLDSAGAHVSRRLEAAIVSIGELLEGGRS